MNFGGTLKLNKFACFTLGFILFLIIYWRSGGASLMIDKSDFVNLKQLLKVGIQAAERGGRKVFEGKSHDLNIKSKGKTHEGANDPVTDADYASHCAMYFTLKNTFSKLTVVSEEHSKNDAKCEQQLPVDPDMEVPGYRLIEHLNDEIVRDKDVTIWIDPLDATQEYTESMFEYVTTMVCVAVNGVPVIGIIHYPFTPKTYWGWITKTKNNLPHAASKPDSKDHPKVVVSRSHPGKVKELTKDAFGSHTTISTAAGAGYKVMEVVNGTYDVYLHATAIKKWDLCAGNAIIKSVDGAMTTINGKDIDYSADSNVTVTGGIIVSRFDHSYYQSRIKEVMP